MHVQFSPKGQGQGHLVILIHIVNLDDEILVLSLNDVNMIFKKAGILELGSVVTL